MPLKSILVVVRSGILQHTLPVAITTKNMAINQDLKALISKTEQLLPEYLAIYFRIFQDLLLPLVVKHSTTVQSINSEQFFKIPIPLPPLSIQEQIITAFLETLEVNRLKQRQAERLLASIDGYLLEALGIVLPPEPANTQRSRMFMVGAGRVLNGRYDPHYHQNYFQSLFQNLQNGLYKPTTLRHVSIKITSGATPLSGGEDYTNPGEGIPFIRSGDINAYNQIDFDEVLYIKREIHESVLQSSKLKKGDLLMAIVGATIGQVAVYEDNREANTNQALAVIRLSAKANPEYIKSFFLSNVGQKVLTQAKRPVARANINLDEIGDLMIPVPPLEKQAEIVAHIQGIRAQAQQLLAEGAAALTAAQTEIEALILGSPT